MIFNWSWGREITLKLRCRCSSWRQRVDVDWRRGVARTDRAAAETRTRRSQGRVAADEERHPGGATGRRVTAGQSVGHKGRHGPTEGRHWHGQDRERASQDATRSAHVTRQQTAEQCTTGWHCFFVASLCIFLFVCQQYYRQVALLLQTGRAMLCVRQKLAWTK